MGWSASDPLTVDEATLAVEAIDRQPAFTPARRLLQATAVAKLRRIAGIFGHQADNLQDDVSQEPPDCSCNVPDFIGYVGELETWRCLKCGLHPSTTAQIRVKLFKRSHHDPTAPPPPENTRVRKP